MVAHTLRPKTQENYTILTRTHILPELGRIRLTNLQPTHLQSFYSKKLNEGYSGRTAQALHGILHKALSQAVRWGLVVRNVSDAVDAPRRVKRPPEILTEAQARAFLDAVHQDRLYALYVTAITTGMRKAELLGLRWSDVDFESGAIRVSQVALTVHKKGVILSEPKTEKSRRAIDLPEVAVRALREHKARQDKIKARSVDWVENDLVFPTRKGTPIGSRNVLKFFHGSLRRAGLPKVRFHSLRHLHSTLLLVAGIHPKIVQERLGHSRIDITMDIYSHVIPGMQKPAAAEMDRILGTVSTP